MISSTSSFVALMTLSSVLAAPVIPIIQQKSTGGALFFMTNDPSGNQVVVNSLSSSGKASFVKTVSTGGKGLTGHGGGPDALFSQDSVLVNFNNLFVVNPGSNTLSAFALDPKNPTSVKQLGKAISTSGEFPVAVARSPGKHRQVCVVNGGAVNGVACYHMNHAKGLQPAANTVRSLGLNQTTPATGPAGTVSDILFSEDGKKLIVSVKGAPPTPGFIAQWDVADDLSLSPNFTMISATAGGLPFGIALIPGKNAIIATDPAVGASTFSLGGSLSHSSVHHKGNSTKAAAGHHKSSNNSTSSVIHHNTKANSSSVIHHNSRNSTHLNSNSNSTLAASTTAIPISGQGAVCWVAHSKKTGSFFVTDILTSIVTEISVDKNLAGKIVKQYNQTANSGTIDNAVGTLSGQDFLYVLATNATSPQIDVLSVGSKAGQAKPLQVLDIGAALKKNKTKFTNINMQGMAVFAP